MSRFTATMIEAAWSNQCFSIDETTGAITPMTIDEFEALPERDPRLRHVRFSKAVAESTSLRLRGVDVQPAAQRN